MHIKTRTRKHYDNLLLFSYIILFTLLTILAMLMGKSAEDEIRSTPSPPSSNINIEAETACLEDMRLAQVSEFSARRECVERRRK